MPRIAFYISSHGFGHATREIEVIANLPESVDVEIVSTAPKWLIEESLSRPFSFHTLNHDPGIIQFDCFKQDVGRTAETWRELLDRYPAMAEEEAKRIEDWGVNVVVGDISPFAIAVGRATGIPSVIIANFSWNWIFKPFVQYDPAFNELNERLADYYRQATLLLRTPLSGGLSFFPEIRDIPLIARRAKRSREETRTALGLGADEKVVLISFGGLGIAGIDKDGLSRYGDITFLTFSEDLANQPNVHYLPPKTTYHPDIVQAADLVLAKMGYGIVTECIVHQIPIAYPPRKDFPEQSVLERESKRYIPTISISSDEFYSGQWDFLLDFFNRNSPEDDRSSFESLRSDGGKVAADILMAFCR